jgi:tetratricopeptide (TPR) repeat protein
MSQIPGDNPADRGIALYKEGNFQDAMPLLRQAIEYEPNRVDLHMYLGFCWGKREKWPDALREFEKSCDLDGSSADAPFFAGVAMVRLGRAREAHSMFHVAVLNNPNHAKAKAAWEQTKAAAAQVTTDGSSAAMPGGMSHLDLGALELEVVGAKQPKPAPTSQPADPFGAALSKLKEQTDGVPAAAKKKAGCGAGLVGLIGLVVLVLATVAPWVAA